SCVPEPAFQEMGGANEPAGNCTNGPAELHCRLSESLAFQITENNRCTILSRQAIHFFVEDAANVFRDRVSLVRGRLLGERQLAGLSASGSRTSFECGAMSDAVKPIRQEFAPSQ